MSALRLQAGRVTEVPLSVVLADPAQPRKEFSKVALTALAESVKARGVQVPLLVRKTEGGKLMLIDGERRLRAAKQAGLKKVPVLLGGDGDDDAQIRVDQAMLNLLRETLTPMEQARMLGDLQQREKLTANDIAARMAKAGMKLSKQEIGERVRLLDLPPWAQDMIDAEQLDAAAALALLPAMAPHALQPKIVKAVQAGLRQRIDWSGAASAKEATQVVQSAMESVGQDLGKTEDYYGAKAVHFDYRKVCTGCEHLRKFSGTAICLNPAEFKRRNDEAKAAGLLPGGRKPKAAPKTEAEAQSMEIEERAAGTERSAENRAGRLREYFDGWLREQIALHLETPAGAAAVDALADYLAAGMPERHADDYDDRDSRLTFGLDDWWNRLRVNAARQALGKKLSRCSLDGFLTMPGSEGEVIAVATACLEMLKPAQVLQVARWAQLDVAASYQVDEAYLALKSKADLVALAAHAGLADAMPAKVSDMKAALLEPVAVAAIGLPPDLRVIWEAEPDAIEDLVESDFGADEADLDGEDE
jgi:ParB/RepB/Spo0J family partition protein